jgi:hypothetical protein
MENGRRGNALNAQLAHLKSRFVNTGCFGTSSKYVHFAGQVVRGDYSEYFLEETARAMLEFRQHVAGTMRCSLFR